MTSLGSHLSDRFFLNETTAGKTSYTKDVLVDADALVALIKENDSNHPKALAISNKLQKQGVSYYFSPFTVAEASTVISYKMSHSHAIQFLREVRKLDVPVISLPETSQSLADNYFIKQKEKGTSYFDCYNMALLDYHKKLLSGIFSFDHVYQQNGFKCIT